MSPRILVNGAKGRMGRALIDSAKQLGLNVTAETDAGDDLAAHASRADVIVDFSSHQATRSMLETAVAQKKALVIGTTGHSGEAKQKLLELAMPGGRIVNFGRTAGNIGELSTRQLFSKQLSIFGTTMGTRDEFLSMIDFFESRKLKPVIDQILPFQKIDEAIKRMESSEQFGKIVLKIQDEKR